MRFLGGRRLRRRRGIDAQHEPVGQPQIDSLHVAFQQKARALQFGVPRAADNAAMTVLISVVSRPWTSISLTTSPNAPVAATKRSVACASAACPAGMRLARMAP